MAGKLAAVSVLLFGTGPVVAHFGVARPIVGFGLFAVGGLLGLIALLWGGIAAARGRAPWTAAVLGLIVTAIFVAVAAPGRSYPPYNDFTTDLGDPPAFVRAAQLERNRGRDMSYPGGEVAEAQRQAYADLAPLDLRLAPADAFSRVVATAWAMPAWEVTAADQGAGLVEGTATTRLFRFKDDFVIRVRPRDDGGSRIDMRSKSRDGRGDLGANAKRIRTFFAALRAAR